MASDQSIVHAEAESLTIRKIGVSDLRDALVSGYADFTAMPTHAVFLCVVYPIIGLIVGRFVTGESLLPMLYPLVAGYALVGPFAALGLYELSRRRELGLDSSPAHVFEIFDSPGFGAVAELGALMALIFVFWLAAAREIYRFVFHDGVSVSAGEFFRQIFATEAGWSLIVVGNGVGFLFALLSFSLGVVSFPLILDRHVSASMAVVTSLRAVIANPVTMALWGLFIAVALALGSLPLFVGLIVVMPVLGHASWHVYRKVVAH
ncbi:MAG TPA: DUF2189 domain-containing protein [Rhizomicrobium sp.]|jgi:uncharacterized membrane protein